MLPRNSCELCKGPASLYCYSDSAFLCWSCDRHVHSANFLVSRHVRQFACSNCHSFSLALIGSGSDNPIQSTCLSCSPSSPCSCVTSESGCEPEPENGTSAAVWHVPRELDRTCGEMARRKGEVRGEEGWGESL